MNYNYTIINAKAETLDRDKLRYFCNGNRYERAVSLNADSDFVSLFENSVKNLLFSENYSNWQEKNISILYSLKFDACKTLVKQLICEYGMESEELKERFISHVDTLSMELLFPLLDYIRIMTL